MFLGLFSKFLGLFSKFLRDFSTKKLQRKMFLCSDFIQIQICRCIRKFKKTEKKISFEKDFNRKYFQFFFQGIFFSQNVLKHIVEHLLFTYISDVAKKFFFVEKIILRKIFGEEISAPINHPIRGGYRSPHTLSRLRPLSLTPHVLGLNLQTKWLEKSKPIQALKIFVLDLFSFRNLK